MRLFVAAVLFPFLISGCEQAATSTDSALLVSHSEAWEDALNRGDIDKLVGLYTRTARMLPPNRGLASGSEAVRAEFGAMIDAGLVGDLTSVEARTAGDIGYNVGLYTLGSSDGEPVDRGKYIEIWRLEDDGRWRISNDIYNSDLPAKSGPEHSTVTLIHEVDDPVLWLAVWQDENGRRADFKRNGALHVHVFQDDANPNLTGLVVAVTDMTAFRAFLESDEGTALARKDGVRMDTLRSFTEIRLRP